MKSHVETMRKMLGDAGVPAEAVHGLDMLVSIARQIEDGQPLAWDARTAGINKSMIEYAACALAGYALGQIAPPQKREAA